MDKTTTNIKASSKPKFKLSKEFKKGFGLGIDAAFFAWIEQRRRANNPVDIAGDVPGMIEAFEKETLYLSPFKNHPYYNDLHHLMLFSLSISIAKAKGV